MDPYILIVTEYTHSTLGTNKTIDVKTFILEKHSLCIRAKINLGNKQGKDFTNTCVPNTQMEPRLGCTSKAVHCLSETFFVNKCKHFYFPFSFKALDPKSVQNEMLI